MLMSCLRCSNYRLDEIQWKEVEMDVVLQIMILGCGWLCIEFGIDWGSDNQSNCNEISDEKSDFWLSFTPISSF